MILRVGLTGGLASGKSTVAKRLEERGIPVLDADRVVHELYAKGEAGAVAVAEEFGRDFLDAAGAVDRPRLAARVFEDRDALARLNARVHPLVFEAQERWFRKLEVRGERVGVVEATLLVESGGRARHQLLVALSAPEGERLARALARTPEADPEKLRRRIAAQLPDAERERVADVVIRNDGTREELLKKADELAGRLLATS